MYRMRFSPLNLVEQPSAYRSKSSKELRNSNSEKVTTAAKTSHKLLILLYLPNDTPAGLVTHAEVMKHTD